MKKIAGIFIFVIYLGVGICSQARGESPAPYPKGLDVYQSRKSEAIKFPGKKTFDAKLQSERSNAQEQGELRGMLSGETSKENKGKKLYLGTWQRQVLYVDGALNPADPATLVYKSDGTFSSQAPRCTTSGTYSVEESAITTVMRQTSCPFNLPLPYTVVYAASFSKDGNTMTLTTGHTKEVFLKAQ